jgi:hypothetical protein
MLGMRAPYDLGNKCSQLFGTTWTDFHPSLDIRLSRVPDPTHTLDELAVKRRGPFSHFAHLRNNHRTGQ